MKGSTLYLIVLLFYTGACVDRITFDVGSPSTFPVVIDGHISDEPGPYTIRVSKAFDIESKLSIKTPISVRKLSIHDDQGLSEVLSKVTEGEYQTSSNGIRGAVGRSYTLEVELLDGRVYKSIPDKLLPTGKVESVNFQYKSETGDDFVTRYGFDITFNATAGNLESYYFLWKFVGTFQYETNPELFTVNCGESRCPRPLPCSAYVLGSDGLQMVKPCECCTCWTDILNTEPIVSDNQVVKDGKFQNVYATYLPITQWTFMHKVHAEVRQMSLSPRAFAFWKAIKDQKTANESLFQPVAGKIPTNFYQVGGNAGPVEGLFYATSISRNSVYITRDDVPDQRVIPLVERPYPNSCESLFPNSSTVKPSFWVD